MGDKGTTRWSGWAWGAIGVTAGFIAITCWWLSRDRGVPFGDAASHLFTVVAYHDLLRAGDIGALLHRSIYYPPLTFLVGAAATFVGGLNAAAPVVGENLVYVPLLALGCYGTGRLLAGPRAGFLAVVFALGSPLVIEQFHVFMIDAPEAALVAVSCWLILASEHFSRVGIAASAGLAAGLGMASKEQFVLFVVGLLTVVLLRNRGWRNWRGIAAFASVTVIVAGPWYVANLHQLGFYASAGLANANLPPRAKPPLLSLSNLGWYAWATLNGLLFAPLFAFAVIGVVRATATVVRERLPSGRPRPDSVSPELLGGLFCGWLALTLTPHHDMRYSMPLLIYLATFGTAWIASLASARRRIATVALMLAAIATTLGASFGMGGQVRILLGPHPIETHYAFIGIAPPDQITIYANRDFNVSAPRRADDVLGLLRALRHHGITGVAWSVQAAPAGDPVFDSQGVRLLARFAGLSAPSIGGAQLVTRGGEPSPTSMNPQTWNIVDPRHAFLIRSPPRSAGSCLALSDGTGLTIVQGSPSAPTRRYYCPHLR